MALDGASMALDEASMALEGPSMALDGPATAMDAIAMAATTRFRKQTWTLWPANWPLRIPRASPTPRSPIPGRPARPRTISLACASPACARSPPDRA